MDRLDGLERRPGGGIAHAQGTLDSTTIPASPDTAYISAHWQILCAVTNWHLLVAVFVAAIVCLFLAWRVDLNEFSMNLFYRNRLVRCYLGASRKPRNPNPFTGFDPSDDLVFSSFQSAHNYSGPFPIVNTTLNLVKGQNLAWQERKSESFVITPLTADSTRGLKDWIWTLNRDKSTKKKAEKRYESTVFALRKATLIPKASGRELPFPSPVLLPARTWVITPRRLSRFS